MHLIVFLYCCPQPHLRLNRLATGFSLSPRKATPFLKTCSSLAEACILAHIYIYSFVCIWLKTSNGYGANNRFEKWSNFVVSSRPDPIGERKDVRSWPIYWVLSTIVYGYNCTYVHTVHIVPDASSGQNAAAILNGFAFRVYLVFSQITQIESKVTNACGVSKTDMIWKREVVFSITNHVWGKPAQP